MIDRRSTPCKAARRNLDSIDDHIRPERCHECVCLRGRRCIVIFLCLPSLCYNGFWMKLKSLYESLIERNERTGECDIKACEVSLQWIQCSCLLSVEVELDGRGKCDLGPC